LSPGPIQSGISDAERTDVVNLRREGCRAGTIGKVVVSANSALRCDSRGQVMKNVVLRERKKTHG
jgi:hypothetical protein